MSDPRRDSSYTDARPAQVKERNGAPEAAASDWQWARSAPSCASSDARVVPAPGLDELEAMVAAVARGDRALLIGVANDSAGWCALDEAPERALRGEVLAVEVAADVVALDADGEIGPQQRSMVEAGERIAAALIEAGCEPVILSSGGAGRWHLLCRVPDADLRDRCRRAARRAGIDVRSGAARLRLPGSAHRAGHQVVLRSHRSWGDAARALQQPVATAEGRTIIGSPQARSVEPSGRLWALIRHGDQQNRFVGADGRCDGSRLVMAICSIAVTEGVSADRVYDLLRCDTNLGGDALRRRGRRGWRNARGWFDHTWAKAALGTRRHAVRSRDDALNELDRVEEAAARARFVGRSAGSTIAVLTAALTLARRRGGVVCPMSVRELATLAGVNVSTVRPALARLRMAGWLHLVGRSEGDRAAVYACRIPLDAQAAAEERTGRAEPAQGHFPSGGVGTVRIWRERLGDDAFSHGALGKSGLRILEAVSLNGSMRVRELAELTGLHPGTVRRSASRLVHAGLLERRGDELAAVDVASVEDAQLEAAAGDRAGRAARRAARHAWERDRFAEWLIERELNGRGRLVQWPRRPEVVLYGRGRAA